jgi:cobalt-zinc-cadmium resistance protein CzcA
VSLPNGGQIPLQEVANVDFQNAPVEISRDNTHRRITIGINVRNRDVESVVADIQKVMNNKVTLPAGYYVTYGGTFENLQAAKSRLSLVVPIALLLIFALLFFTFNSVLEAAIIFLAIPLSAIGGIWALWIRDMPFSVSAGIGFIALFGVAVLNGIVLLSFFKQLADEGLSVSERLKKGLELRFRPVIMTASVASLGFLPMALSNSPGAEVQRPLATVVIGGLITATFLTLIVIPVVYSIIMTRRENKLKMKPFVGVFLMGLFAAFISVGQTAPTVLSLQDCLKEAMMKNALLKTGNLEIDASEALIASGREIPKASIDFQYGKTQTYFSRDYTIIAAQSIPWPSQLKAQVNALRSQKILAEKRLKIAQNLVTSSVKYYYFGLLVQYAQGDYLKKQDSIYSQMTRAARLKFSQGETNKLEFVAAEARLKEFQQKRKSLEADIQSNYQNLAYWINRQGSFLIQTNQKIQLDLRVSRQDVSKNPYLALLNEQVEHGKLLTQVEREKLKPDIRMGLTSQSIENFGGQNFVQAGLSIPIFRAGQKSKIASAEKQELVAQSQLEQQKSQFMTELQTQISVYEKLGKSLEYYQTTALEQAKWLETTALKNYQQGEIEYVEMLQNTQQAWQIREQYLQEVLAYNQSIIQIEIILGNE